MITDFEDVVEFVIGLWATITLFVTFPLWILPYIIIQRILDM